MSRTSANLKYCNSSLTGDITNKSEFTVEKEITENRDPISLIRFENKDEENNMNSVDKYYPITIRYSTHNAQQTVKYIYISSSSRKVKR